MSRFQTLARYQRSHSLDGIVSFFVTLTLRPRRRRGPVDTAVLEMLAHR